MIQNLRRSSARSLRRKSFWQMEQKCAAVMTPYACKCYAGAPLVAVAAA